MSRGGFELKQLQLHERLKSESGQLSDRVSNNKTDRIFEIIQIYMRLLMSQELSPSDEALLQRYNREGINFNMSKEKKKETSKPQPEDLEVSSPIKGNWKKPNLDIDEHQFDFYLCETDYYMGDMVIAFPNPDSEEAIAKYGNLNTKEAIIDFQTGVGMRYNVQLQQDALDCMMMKMAFINCYSRLADEKEDDKSLIDEKDSTGKKHKNLLLQFYEQFEIMMNQVLQKQEKLDKKQEKKSILKKVPEEYNLDPKSRKQKQMRMYNCLIHKRKRLGIMVQSIGNVLDEDREADWVTRLVWDRKNYFINRERNKLQKDGKSFLDTSQAVKCKKRAGGGFLQLVDSTGNPKPPKKSKKIKRQKTKEGVDKKKKKKGEGEKYHWRRTGKETRDFLTLIRNLILIRLSQQGFLMRNFLSEKGQTIFTVLYYSEDNLKTQAEHSKMPKILNIEFTDLMSLEPCDNSFRPLRLNNRLWRPKEYEKEQGQISEYFLYLRPKIIQLLKEINFKKMAKEVNLQGLNEQIFTEGSEDILHDAVSPSDETWTAFYEYLSYLHSKVVPSRERFCFDSDEALLINNTLNPRDLYFLKHKNEIQTDNYEALLSQNRTTTLLLSGTEGKPTWQQQADEDDQDEDEKIQIERKQAGNKKKNQNFTLTEQQEHEVMMMEIRIRQKQQEYKTLKEILHLKQSKNISTKHIKERLREILAFEYGQYMREAIMIVNYQRPGCLKNMWDLQNFELFEPSFEYFIPHNNLSYKRRCKINTIWKKYEVTESGRISLFSSMERLKLTYASILQTINLNYQLNCDYIEQVQNQTMDQVFALNDSYELTGEPKTELFKQLFETFDMDKFMKQTQAIHFSENLRVNSNDNEGVSIRTVRTPSHMKLQSPLNDQIPLERMVRQKIGKPKLERKITLQRNKYTTTETLFVQPKLKNLDYVWRFQISQPWFVPSDAIRNYYGEKLALYFLYLGHYTKSLLYIGLLGLIVAIIQYINISEEVNAIAGMLFGMFNTQWINVMINEWYRNEKYYAVKFGQFNSKKSATDQRAEQRPSFIGQFQRSAVNDNLNTQYYPFYKTIIRMLSNLVIVILIFSVYQASVVGLFYLSKYLYQEFIFQGVGISFIKMDVTLPAVINVILILFCDEFYDKLSESLTDYENHQTVNDFESNFILKKFFLSLLSYYGPIFQIAFLSENIGVTCAYDDCYLHARYYFSAIFIVLFSLNIWEILKPKLQLFRNTGKCSIEVEEEEVVEDEQKGLFSEEQQAQQQVNPFRKINRFIEAESIKDTYVISSDRYGTVDDYMEISIQLALLGLYGTLYPMSYMIGLLWNVLEMQTDKNKLIEDNQRPVPLDESSIGIWYVLIEFIANVCIIQNSGIIMLLGYRMQNPLFHGVGFFLTVLFANFFGKFFQLALIDDIPYRLQVLIQRQAYLIKCTMEIFKMKGRKDKVNKCKHFPIIVATEERDLIFYPLYKTYGCILEEKNEFQFEYMGADSFVDLSEEDEIQEQLEMQEGTKKFELATIKRKPQKQVIPQYEFKFMKPKDLATDRLKLQEFLKKTHQVHLGLKEFQSQVERSCGYQTKWNDQKINKRYLFLRRTRVLLINLDYRRIKIYKDRSKVIAKDLFKYEVRKMDKFHNKQLDTEEEKERDQIIQEIKVKTALKAKKKVRRVIIIRIQGVWFHQFRKSSKYTGAKNMIKLIKYDTKIKRRKQKKQFLQQKYDMAAKGKPSGTLFAYEELLKNRQRVFDFLMQLDLLKIQKVELFDQIITPQTSHLVQQPDAFNEPHSYVTVIEKFYPLQLRKIEDKQRIKYNYQFPVCSYNHFSQIEMGQLAMNGAERNFLRNRDLNNLILLRRMDQLKLALPPTLFAEYLYQPMQPKMQLWLCSSIPAEPDPILQLRNAVSGTHAVLEYIEIDDQSHYSLNNIVKSQSILKLIAGTTLPHLAILKQSFMTVDLFLIERPPLIDRMLDPFTKGCIATLYNSTRAEPLCMGMTLRDTIELRNLADYPYKEHELITFLHWLLSTLVKLESGFNTHHGNIHPSNFLLVSNANNHFRYKLIGLHGLFHKNNYQYTFSRPIHHHSREYLFLSPELMRKYRIARNLIAPDELDVDLQKNDIYGVGILILSMMTLGNALEEITTMIEKEVKNVTMDNIDQLQHDSVGEYISKNEMKLINKYPVMLTLIKDMLQSQSLRKSLPYLSSLIASEYEQLKQSKQNDLLLYHEGSHFSLQLEAQVKAKASSLLPQKNFYEDLQLYERSANINQAMAGKLHSLLSNQLYKQALLTKLKLTSALQQELGRTTQMLQYSFRLKNDSWFTIFSHIQHHFDFYCDLVEHQKVLFDLLYCNKFYSLEQMLARSSFKDISSSISLLIIKESYVADTADVDKLINEIYHYIDISLLEDKSKAQLKRGKHIQKQTQSTDQVTNQIQMKKRLNLNKNMYIVFERSLSEINKECIYQSLLQVKLIKAYTYTLSLEYQLANPLLDDLTSGIKTLWADPTVAPNWFCQQLLCIMLKAQIESDQFNQDSELLFTTINDLKDLIAQLKEQNEMRSYNLQDSLGRILLELQFTWVQELCKRMEFLLADLYWKDVMLQVNKQKKLNLCIFEQTRYVRFETLTAELHWAQNDEVNFDLTIKSIIKVFMWWLEATGIRKITFAPTSSSTKLAGQSFRDETISDRSQHRGELKRIAAYQDLFIYQLIELEHFISLLSFCHGIEGFMAEIVDSVHKLELYVLMESGQISYLIPSILIRTYRIINERQGNKPMRNIATGDYNPTKKTSLDLYQHYIRTLTNDLLLLDVGDTSKGDYLTSICFENFIKYFLANLVAQKDEKRRMTQLLLGVVTSLKKFDDLPLAQFLRHMEMQFKYGKLLYQFKSFQAAMQCFWQIHNECKNHRTRLMKSQKHTHHSPQLMSLLVTSLQWCLKCLVTLKELYNASKLLIGSYEILDYGSFWWPYLYQAIAIDFYLLGMNPVAQLICQVGIKLTHDILLYEIRGSATEVHYVQKRHQIEMIRQEFTMMYTKFLIEEQTNRKNDYLHSAFNIKQFVLTNINHNLHLINTATMRKMDQQQEFIAQRTLEDFTDYRIRVEEQLLSLNLQKFEELLSVQSSLLEEGGDPVSAIKFIDPQYLPYLYDQGENFNQYRLEEIYRKINQTQSLDMASNYFMAQKKFKGAVYKLTLNLFDKSLPQLERVGVFCTTCVQTLVEEIQSQLAANSFQSAQPDQMYAEVSPFWNPIQLEIIRQGKDIQLQQFQQLKLLYYASRMKLLEGLSMRGFFKDAGIMRQELLLYYSSFLYQHQQDGFVSSDRRYEQKQAINNLFIKGLFEYSLAIFYFYSENYPTAQSFFSAAKKNFKKFNLLYFPRRIKNSKSKSSKHHSSTQSILGDQLEIHEYHRELVPEKQLPLKEFNQPLYEMQNDFGDPDIELQVLLKQFHFITIDANCMIYEARAMVFSSSTASEHYMATFDVLVQMLEDLRKVMGRKSIPYADALLVYIKYLMLFKERNSVEEFKIILKTKYFLNVKQSKKSQLFRPGLNYREPENNELEQADRFTFYSLDEIEQRFTPALHARWIQDLTLELINYYEEYLRSVRITEHLNLAECHLILHKLNFIEKKLFFSQIAIDKSLAILQALLPDCSHPLYIHIYVCLGHMKENMKEITMENIWIALKLKEFTPEEKLLIAKGLLQQNVELNECFDEYKVNTFDFYLTEKLKNFIKENSHRMKKNFNFKRTEKLERSQMQEILNIALDQVAHEQSFDKVSAEELLKQESIKHHRKAFMICKRIFVDRTNNNLFQTVEDKYISLTREEEMFALRKLNK